jgi:hypothetical protein
MSGRSVFSFLVFRIIEKGKELSMRKIYFIKVCAIICILNAILILPCKGNTQTNNKLKSKRVSIKNPKLHKKLIKPKGQISKPTKLSAQIKELEKKDGEIKTLKSNLTKFSTKINELEKELLLAKTKISEGKKAEAKTYEEIKSLRNSLNKLYAELSVQSDVSKKYNELINCYRASLFTWDDLNGRQGLTEDDRLVIGIELRRSLFDCPPI